MMQHLSNETIIDYLHGALSPQEDAAVYAHVETCTECRKEYEAEVALSEMLRGLAEREEREFPATLKAEIWSRIREAQPSPLRRFFGALRPAIAIPVAAAIAVVAYFGTAYLGSQPPPSIEASYYLQDHAALDRTIPFNDRSASNPTLLENATASVDTQQTAVNVETASFTADVNP
jgi:anti-sigma factor RsiW